MYDIVLVAVFEGVENVSDGVSCFLLVVTGLLHDTVKQLAATQILQNDIEFVGLFKEIQLSQLTNGYFRFMNAILWIPIFLTMFGWRKSFKIETSFRNPAYGSLKVSRSL